MLARAGWWLVLLAGGLAALGQERDIQGVWAPQLYRLKQGAQLKVDGHIFFAERHWTVLFFVIQQGELRRGSAEGGSYSLQGERLVFTHHYHLSSGRAVGGLPESPLRMEIQKASEAPREACTIRLEGGRLTIFFPSGNSMEFVKVE